VEQVLPGAQALSYDRTAGLSGLVGFNTTGKVGLDYTNNGWRKSWDMMWPGVLSDRCPANGNGEKWIGRTYGATASIIDPTGMNLASQCTAKKYFPLSANFRFWWRS
jgi:hypothetical protein